MIELLCTLLMFAVPGVMIGAMLAAINGVIDYRQATWIIFLCSFLLAFSMWDTCQHINAILLQ